MGLQVKDFVMLQQAAELEELQLQPVCSGVALVSPPKITISTPRVVFLVKLGEGGDSRPEMYEPLQDASGITARKSIIGQQFTCVFRVVKH